MPSLIFACNGDPLVCLHPVTSNGFHIAVSLISNLYELLYINLRLKSKPVAISTEQQVHAKIQQPFEASKTAFPLRYGWEIETTKRHINKAETALPSRNSRHQVSCLSVVQPCFSACRAFPNIFHFHHFTYRSPSRRLRRLLTAEEQVI